MSDGGQVWHCQSWMGRHQQLRTQIIHRYQVSCLKRMFSTLPRTCSLVV
jgi:hypothetical protein